MANYAIGDVQGCFDQLQQLLKKINFTAKNDTLIFLGDVVNRGPQSLEVLRFIYNHQDSMQMVLGNHDFHLLSCAFSVNTMNKKDTFIDILQAPDKKQLIEFLLTQKIVIKQNKNLFVHAGIPPIWGVQKTIQQAEKISYYLQNDTVNFIKKMYANQPDLWRKDLNEIDELIYSVNSFMRMRFCTQNGKLEFNHKDNYTEKFGDYDAWFMHKNKLEKYNIYFGHWSRLKNTNTPKKFPLDTGCIWGGTLSAINLENNKITSIPC